MERPGDPQLGDMSRDKAVAKSTFHKI
jgi:hypothetical protein